MGCNNFSLIPQQFLNHFSNNGSPAVPLLETAPDFPATLKYLGFSWIQVGNAKRRIPDIGD